MPIYEYACADCGAFTALRPMSEYRKSSNCPHCGNPSPRAMITAPVIAGMPAARRKAHATNEKARHEPMLASQLEKKHGSGCSCCIGKKSSAALTADGGKTFPSKRPWMISH